MRKYVPLKHVGYHGQSGMPISEEYRVFIYAGKILAIDDYWIKNNGVSIMDAEYRWIESIVRDVKSTFVTVDLARKEDGTLVIMEMGDGQVSGLQQLSADIFYCRFREKRV